MHYRKYKERIAQKSKKHVRKMGEKLLFELGITYASPEIKKETDYVSVKTKFTWNGGSGNVSLGFQMNTMKAEENKMFITYTLKGNK